jgi:hypothetical protein
VTGPLVEAQLELGPVKVHPGVPAGASDPATPVMVAVKVIIGPPAVLDWIPVTVIVGVTFATTIEIGLELAEL